MSLPALIERLEGALARGALAEVLAAVDPAALGPELDGLYHGLLGWAAPGGPAARRPWVGLALRRFAQAVAPPARVFAAEPDGADLVVAGGRLSFDAAVRAMGWGVGFQAPPALRDRLQVARVQGARARLYQDLRGVPLIAARVAAPPAGFGEEEGLGEGLERLVRDALSLQFSCRFAPLAEDVLAATDLRVAVAGGPRRGVRVQVTAALEGPRHAHKVAQAARAGAVLLSPVTLAAALPAVPGAAQRFPGPPGVQARELRDALTGALGRALKDPRGAVAALPAELGQVMAVVVVAGRALRGRQRLRWPPLGVRGAL